MSHTHHTPLKPILLALGLAFGLAACGGQDKQAAAPAEGKPAAAQSGELAEKQEIVINNGAEPESLDPHKVSGVPESNLLRQMLVGLTSTDNEGNTVAGMAEKWESADNKVWTFTLRDAKWSNGDPVTAEDFVFSFRRVTDPATASPYASYLADVKVANAQEIIDGKAKPDTLGVKAIDAKTLEITLNEPVPYFPRHLNPHLRETRKPKSGGAARRQMDAARKLCGQRRVQTQILGGERQNRDGTQSALF